MEEKTVVYEVLSGIGVAEKKIQLEQLEKEENDAFLNLEKNIITISNIVKDARNIHKSIRDAITEAVVHLSRAQISRRDLVKARSELTEELKEESKKTHGSERGYL